MFKSWFKTQSENAKRPVVASPHSAKDYAPSHLALSEEYALFFYFSKTVSIILNKTKIIDAYFPSNTNLCGLS